MMNDNNPEFLKNLAKECDLAIESGSTERIQECINTCYSSLKSDINAQDDFKLYYYIGNLYAALKIDGKNKNLQALNAYRQAAKYCSEIPRNIHVNIANQLKILGRKIEALSIYENYTDVDVCTDIDQIDEPNIIGLINGSQTLIEIGSLLENENIKKYYFLKAAIMTEKLNKIAESDGVSEYYKDKIISSVEKSKLKVLKDFNKKTTSILDNDLTTENNFNGETSYRKWCLENSLFMNHMNDITKSHKDSSDCIQFPTYIGCSKYPHFFLAFSEIKRSYCFSRFLAFEGMHELYPKYEEDRLSLSDSGFHAYSGKVERLKTSLRISFSIFDKIATLLLRYFGKESEKNYFKPSFFIMHFEELDNQFISAMECLSCDLSDKHKKYNSILEPDSKHLREIRNALEHGSLAVVNSQQEKCCDENYSYFITLDTLQNDVIKILKLARATMIYLIFAIIIEENKKRQDNQFGTPEVGIVAHWNPETAAEKI